ncbi:MAG TPA: galactokinase [Bdellovibrionales bacterium]|nr:galactokinase [Bdellovibrionales bacterium]
MADESGVVKAWATGRVNLIGEHTDYNGGFVLPALIPQKTEITLRLVPGKTVVARSSSMIKAGLPFELGQEAKSGNWVDYLQGATAILSREGFNISGFEAAFESSIPVGSGLSSSAAFLVAVFRALNQAFNLKLSPLQIALLSQKVENEFVGARVGVMDPMVISLAEPGRALFIDTNDLSHRSVAFPAEMELVVVSSGVSHRNAGGGYNQRRRECEEACEQLGVQNLRELSPSGAFPEGLAARIETLPPVNARRARHVLSENQRVLRAVTALESGDLETLGRILYEGHESLKNDYQVSIAEIDRMVELAREEPAIYGARLTGGGFGGSVVMIAKRGLAAVSAHNIAARYARETGLKPSVLVPQDSGRAPVIDRGL